MKGEKEAVLSQLDSLKDKLNVSEVGRSVIQHSLVAYLYNGCVCVPQVCVGKEREERVRLELRVTELEEEVDTQASHMTSIKWVGLVITL